MRHRSRMITQTRWYEYLAARSDATRNRLADIYQPLLTRIVDRLVRCGYAQGLMGREDLLQAAAIGLIDAIQRFDPDASTPFERFAQRRIRGAVIDQVRGTDWRSRGQMARVSRGWRFIQIFQADHGRMPSDDEIAASVGDRVLTALKRDGVHIPLSSFRRWTQGPNSIQMSDRLDRHAVDPTMAATRRDLRQALMRGLRRDERLLLTCLIDGLDLQTAGAAVGVSHSRASQILNDILQRLRARDDLRRLVDGDPDHNQPISVQSVLHGDKAVARRRKEAARHGRRARGTDAPSFSTTLGSGQGLALAGIGGGCAS